MAKNILITGGAGFVGSHLADELLDHGYTVRALDNLSPQVHGVCAQRPDYLAEDVELLEGDVRDPQAVWKALEDVDAVYHFAATVGVGQSMYQIENYTSVNGIGTAVLLEALAKRPVERLIVASSMSIYGEGLYRTQEGTSAEGRERSLEQLKAHDWEIRGADGKALQPVPTPESKSPALPSVYAISKYHQERLCLNVARAYGIAAVGLRFFNIYGTRQALSNPYTGVLAIFASRFLNGKPPLINEDGLQQRDFVSVHDVARACRLALEVPGAADQVFNVGSGRHFTIREIADQMARAVNCSDIEPVITGRYRMGDIRNCFADVSLARKVLGYKPQVTLEQGLADLAEWLEGQTAEDHAAEASRELATRGLTV
ncbi:MAG TPA: NAD-dependent epimerase/dehydratase family protein [Chthoniobacteraceae bacterium]|jgi:dTDP-L-rhamnose 4-epimerase|nr:NAD-dependent epimerase/dehydratase family protein [Chthoniobacteraceae bacterium]